VTKVLVDFLQKGDHGGFYPMPIAVESIRKEVFDDAFLNIP
jgi:hypothetical protein